MLLQIVIFSERINWIEKKKRFCFSFLEFYGNPIEFVGYLYVVILTLNKSYFASIVYLPLPYGLYNKHCLPIYH